jgi:crotonobetainyl-CoA:carnitine CoA-transferase CaiB-like acyl-CoA transferase
MHSGALAGYRVIDLSRVRSGPTCTKFFSDWGADVIRIDRPDGSGDPMGDNRLSSDYLNLHRNKRSLTLDLKQPAGLELLKKLVATADVVVENFRPNVKYRLGVDYESLRAVNPRIVYASISAFGEDGPYRSRPGFDHVAQAMGGLMYLTGYEDGEPLRVGISLADIAAGLFAAMGIFIALLEREKSGEGQWVTTSLIDSQIHLLDYQAMRWLIDKKIPERRGNDHPQIIPAGVYPSSDGYFCLQTVGNESFLRLMEVLNLSQFATNPDFASPDLRAQHRNKINAAIRQRSVERSTVEWVERLNAAGVPAGPIYRIDEVFADPQVRHNEVTRTLDHPLLGPIEVLAPPMALSRTPSQVDTPAPGVGQHTPNILHELGYSNADCDQLRQAGVV